MQRNLAGASSRPAGQTELAGIMVRLAAFSTAIVLALALWAAWPHAGAALTNGASAPEFAGENWINSKPLNISGLKGRVVLVEFWTYG